MADLYAYMQKTFDQLTRERDEWRDKAQELGDCKVFATRGRNFVRAAQEAGVGIPLDALPILLELMGHKKG